jgi:hypothetical protein
VVGRYVKRFGLENEKARDSLENLSVDGRIMLKRIFEKWNGVIDWIDVAQDMDRERAVVDVVMNIRVL